MKAWLEVNLRGGRVDKRLARRIDGGWLVIGQCPGCICRPFLVRQTTETLPHEDRMWCFGTRCYGCNDPVGYLFVRAETIFGIQEDEAVQARARVYDATGRDRP